ncbi:CMRF35-like molecule 6 [Colossoma macropomum]|uniref:CMRF35-like molecule 6 n=1 Tax=Colossoma macropomum TaxID=42526 RepID=UPI00186457C6|nr:CMRF35-like molecule 6 [Colossoma macropomum]
MKILLIFTLFLISVGGGESERVTGYSGGGVLINCAYKTNFTSNPKYFCKGSWSNCADQIRTRVKNEWINRGRFSLFDDTRAAVFMVNISELTVEDSGTYYCGIDIFFDYDVYTTVELNVNGGTQAGQPIWPRHLGPSTSSASPTGLAVYSAIGAGLVLMTAALITAI